MGLGHWGRKVIKWRCHLNAWLVSSLLKKRLLIESLAWGYWNRSVDNLMVQFSWTNRVFSVYCANNGLLNRALCSQFNVATASTCNPSTCAQLYNNCSRKPTPPTSAKSSACSNNNFFYLRPYRLIVTNNARISIVSSFGHLKPTFQMECWIIFSVLPFRGWFWLLKPDGRRPIHFIESGFWRRGLIRSRGIQSRRFWWICPKNLWGTKVWILKSLRKWPPSCWLI